MSAKQTRGVKRTCQNADCGSRFYDLNREKIVCPICQSPYEIASAPAVTPGFDRSGRKVKREYVIEEPAAVVETEQADADDALAEVAEDAVEPVAAEADETFLEEEEDGGDVSTILGGAVEGEEEP